MLPAPSRLRASREFTTTMRRGIRVGRPTLVMHALKKQSPPARVGFVVSKVVGNAVVRNRVKRRLRHLTSAYLASSPAFDVVIRALPLAASEPHRLAGDFASAWATCVDRVNK